MEDLDIKNVNEFFTNGLSEKYRCINTTVVVPDTYSIEISKYKKIKYMNVCEQDSEYTILTLNDNENNIISFLKIYLEDGILKIKFKEDYGKL